MHSFGEEGEEEFIHMSFMCVIIYIPFFGIGVILNFVPYLAGVENSHFVRFDSHITFKLRCFILSDNPIILRCCFNQQRVGSKGDSPSTT